MKKTLVLLLIVAVTGGLFAQATLSGQIYGNAVLGQGSSFKDADGDYTVDPTAGGTMGRIRIEVSAQDKTGTIGAWGRFESGWTFDANNAFGLPPGTLPAATFGGEGGAVAAYGYAFWQPIDWFRLQVGVNPDGHFGASCISRWDFYDLAGDVGVVTENWLFSDAFYAGFGSFGSVLTLTPVKDLAINVGVPFEAMDGDRAINVYKSTNAQVAYTIEGVGDVKVNYAGDINDTIFDDTGAFSPNPATIYGYFDYSAVQDLNVELGVGYKFAIKNEGNEYTPPVSIGLGASYKTGPFGIKVRVMGQFAEKFAPKVGDDEKGNTVIVADILPNYAINDSLTVYLSAGLNFSKPDSADPSVFNGYSLTASSDSVLGWHVNPYISKTIGDGAFLAGFRVESDGSKDLNGDKFVTWSVPIAISYSF